MNIDYCAKTRVEMLAKRVERCVCKYCGGELRLKRMLFNREEGMRIEVFCEDCQRIEFGVEKSTYLAAKSFVEEFDFNYYNDLEQAESIKRMNIAKVCEIISWADRRRGWLADTGFTVNTAPTVDLNGELVFISAQDAEKICEGSHDE